MTELSLSRRGLMGALVAGAAVGTMELGLPRASVRAEAAGSG